jgi:MFS transporter, MHS family, proline/betaine transporter
MPSWGWRMAFLFGSIIAVFGLYMRRQMSETPEFEKAKREGRIVSLPSLETVKKDWRSHLAYTGISAGFGVLYSNAIVNAPAIIRTKFGLDTPSVLLITMFTLGSSLLFLPVFGMLSDKIGVRKVMCGGMVVSGTMLVFALKAVDALDFRSFLIFQTLALIAFAAHSGPIHTLTKYLYPTERRCSGVSLGAGVGVAIFSGLSPIIMRKLQVVIGSFWGPSLFVIACQTLACISVCLAPSYTEKS